MFAGMLLVLDTSAWDILSDGSNSPTEGVMTAQSILVVMRSAVGKYRKNMDAELLGYLYLTTARC